MQNFTPGLSFVGGALMGLSASLVLWTHGKIAGVAGIYGGAIQRTSDRTFRLSFLAGLLGSGVVLRRAFPSLVGGPPCSSLGMIAVAGLLVGFGTRLGGGCTSGHGICGLSRLSKRSLAATMAFMTTGMITVLVVRHWIGVGR